MAPRALETPASPQVASEIAPSGRLRAAINLGNPVLAQRSSEGALSGVTVDLARDLGSKLGVQVDLFPYASGGNVVRALQDDRWDVAFLAAEPERAGTINFTTPYLFIEGTYLVPGSSNVQSVEDVDTADARIAVGDGAAYHLTLVRLLKHATIWTAPTSSAAIDLFVKDRFEAVAGVRQTLEAAAVGIPGARVLKDSFSRIDQAIAIPRDKGLPSFTFVQAYLKARLEDEFIVHSLARSGQHGVRTAAPSNRGA